MPNLDLINFEDIYTAALRRVKGDSNDTETINKIREIINTRYRQICSKKKWRFLRVTNRSLVLPIKYTTGTISITSGSRTVTGVGTTWTQTHRNWWIKPNGVDRSYRVITVLSTTQLIIAAPHTSATITGAGYKLYQSELALFPDLEDIDDVRIEGRTTSIKPVGAAVINQLRQRFHDREGRPDYYTIEGQALFEGPVLGQFILGYDFLGQGNTRAISFFPHIPDQNYTIQIPYKRSVSTLVNATDISLIPIEHRSVLLNYALSDWYASNDSQMAAYYQRLGDADLNEMTSRYLDTDDIIRLKPAPTRQYPHSYLLHHSSTYFDTEG